MWKCKERVRVWLVILGVCVAGAGCRYDMQDQPKMKPYRGTTFFTDGLSARQPIPGTVARGFLRADSEYYTGKKARTPGAAASGSPGAAATGSPGAAQAAPGASPAASPTTGQAIAGQNATIAGQNGAANAFPDDVETFPFPVTEETVRRGRDRYNIFCSACHGLTGNGDGMIVRRGFRRAASFHSDTLRQAPVGHFFDAITNGWGAMPSYASQIPVQDRWAIVAYVRALQLSQQNNQATPSASPVPGASPGPAPSPGSGGHD